jgi:mRNA interferase MazF
VSDWVPEAGELVWVDFSPTAGTEQAGRRPALVISGCAFNASSGRAVVLPITSKHRDFPFQIELPPDAPLSGAAMADQVRTIDWRARFAKSAGSVSADVLDTARGKLGALVGLG